MLIKRIERTYCNFLFSRPGLFGSIFKGALSGASCCYGSVIALRNAAFDRGLIPIAKPPDSVVISVGNLQAGGAGKTPFTLLLASLLNQYTGTAILSRGYRSKLSGRAPVLINDSMGIKFSPSFCGDEPSLLAENLPSTSVIVGKDRTKAAYLAAAKGAKAIILDDGFQHRRLARDFDIVLIDAGLPSEAEHLFPRGLLREDYRSLARADLIVITKAENALQAARAQERVSRYSSAPVVIAELAVAKISASRATLPDSVNSLCGALFCGIARPASFLQAMKNHGLRIISQDFFADHEDFTPAQIGNLAEKAQRAGASYLICTEKDAVKIAPWMENCPLPILWPKMEMRVTEGMDNWNTFLKGLQERIIKCG